MVRRRRYPAHDHPQTSPPRILPRVRQHRQLPAHGLGALPYGRTAPLLPRVRAPRSAQSGHPLRLRDRVQRRPRAQEIVRYTDYPYWSGPADWFFEMDQDPPYDGHRWLRLKNDSDIHRTPINDIEYKTWGTALKSWAIAAQEHYSFLENLLDNKLDLYKFGKRG